MRRTTNREMCLRLAVARVRYTSSVYLRLPPLPPRSAHVCLYLYLFLHPHSRNTKAVLVVEEQGALH